MNFSVVAAVLIDLLSKPLAAEPDISATISAKNQLYVESMLRFGVDVVAKRLLPASDVFFGDR
jgi:hypothetical protein